MAVITISRQIGSLGDELASYLANKLNCSIIDRSYVMNNIFSSLEAAETAKLNESAKAFNSLSPDNISFKDIMCARISELIDEANNKSKDIIIIGLGSSIFLKENYSPLNIRIYASEKTRISRLKHQFSISEDEASSLIAIGDRKHKRFVSILWDKDLSDPSLYDLSINTDNTSIEECADGIIALLSKKKLRDQITEETKSSDLLINHQTETPVFKNETEAEFARILDLYHIEWMYEPKTFPIEWDLEGNITSAFSPDFYLPRFNLYLELTTMEQKYVTKKNKKAKRCMELYPGTNIKIVYKKDFEELVERLSKFQ